MSEGMEKVTAGGTAAGGESAGDADTASTPAAGGDSTSGAVALRILVVEDARILRRMLVKILQDAGHTCEEAGNGHEAMAFLRRSKSMNNPYDLVLTDIMMPEMDGWELIDSMIDKKFFPAIPVVVITATASIDSVKRCRKVGIKHYIVKPFESARVLETVAKATASRGQESTPQQ